MRDPARVPRVLALLAEYWMANPDLRLGQIAGRAAQLRNIDPTYMEDEVLERYLLKQLKDIPRKA